MQVLHKINMIIHRASTKQHSIFSFWKQWKLGLFSLLVSLQIGTKYLIFILHFTLQRSQYDASSEDRFKYYNHALMNRCASWTNINKNRTSGLFSQSQIGHGNILSCLNCPLPIPKLSLPVATRKAAQFASSDTNGSGSIHSPADGQFLNGT